MRLQDILPGGRDLREMNSADMVELLDELRAIAMKRGTELLEQGRAGARKAIGAPDPGAPGSAFVVGVTLGVAVGAAVALLVTPMAGREARRRLAKQVDQVRERMPEVRVGSNGRSHYQPAPAGDMAHAGMAGGPIA